MAMPTDWAITDTQLRALANLKIGLEQRVAAAEPVFPFHGLDYLRELSHFPEYARRMLLVLDKTTRKMVPFKLNWIQQKILDAELRLRAEGTRPWILILKYRRGGVTTLQQGLNFHHQWANPHSEVRTYAHRKDDTRTIFQMVSWFYDFMPKEYRHQKTTAGTYDLVYPAPWYATYHAETAGATSSGRGAGFDRVHLCLAGDQQVLIENGGLAAIKDVTPGTKVITRTGALANVLEVATTASNRMKHGRECLVITPWLAAGTPIMASPDHKIWTPSGWCAAGNLKVGDSVGLPVRPVTHGRSTFPYRARRPSGRGLFPKEAPDFPLSREIGYAAGYYLAEGWAAKVREKDCVFNEPRWCSIGLAHDFEDAHLADRAVRALEAWFTSWHRRRSKDSRTEQTVLYGTSFAESWVNAFGARDEKRVPDWVFDAPIVFCEGLVEGYFAGDGSRCFRKDLYEDPTVAITSVRPGLLFQVRDLLASLGIGWGGIHFKRGRSYRRPNGHLTNERDAWTLTVHGEAAMNLRNLCGHLENMEPDETMVRRRRTTKYRISDGMVWLPIRKIERREEDVFFDLVLAHKDHSFRTPGGVVSNSEASQYPNLPMLHEGLNDTIAPNGSYIVESTAFGTTGKGAAFYEAWQKAVAGESAFTPLFFPWHSDPGHRVPLIVPDELGELSGEEAHLRKLYKLDMEQIKWWRQKRAELVSMGRTERSIYQEHPSDSESAFQEGGDGYYDEELVKAAEVKCVDPIRVEQNGKLRIFEDPHPDGRYLITADPAEGVGRDDSAATGWNVTTGRQAFSWRWNRMPPDEFGRKLAELGQRWKPPGDDVSPAYIMVERENHGHAVLIGLMQLASYPRPQVHHEVPETHDEKKPQPRAGWRHNHIVLTTALGRMLREEYPIILDREVIASIRRVSLDDKGTAEFTGRDLAVTAGLAAIGFPYAVRGELFF